MTGSRSAGPELLGRPDQDRKALSRSLHDLEAVNRWLGGYRALRLHLSPLRDSPRIRLLDVGSGDGATLLHLRRWAPDGWRFVGVELNPGIASLAVRRVAGTSRIRVVRGDALRLPFANGSFDVAACTLTLHHFDDEEAVTVVREMARVARRKVLVNDLERSRIHHLGSLLLSATLWRRSPITRHDGPLSVRRSFTLDELEAIGEGAGLPWCEVRRRLLFRVILDGVPGPDRAKAAVLTSEERKGTNDGGMHGEGTGEDHSGGVRGAPPHGAGGET